MFNWRFTIYIFLENTVFRLFTFVFKMLNIFEIYFETIELCKTIGIRCEESKLYTTLMLIPCCLMSFFYVIRQGKINT